ncbi:alpha-2-macroglobulin-like protein 1 isoform X3 [Anarrhichthys ocellatus]|uniref:alpha-2-macroglobulin-like protein 1 isoform X3 n=1 Tax=Anarrhichthys ocellatus TaxID=433405 RepID=UPI0012ECF8DD|nr:alpha-2-macroglobulin-like protein 1 isoform X3 [Anarrhichthys ocellatus]
MCSVRAIDQSVLLLQPEQELTIDSVYSRLPLQKLSGYSYEVEDSEPYPCIPEPIPEPQPEIVDAAGRAKRSVYFGPTNQKNDVYSIFKEIGIKIVTNSDVKKPHNCHKMVPEMLYYDSGGIEMLQDITIPAEADTFVEADTEETVRTYFPETWIWELVSVG